MGRCLARVLLNCCTATGQIDVGSVRDRARVDRTGCGDDFQDPPSARASNTGIIVVATEVPYQTRYRVRIPRGGQATARGSLTVPCN